MRALLLTLALVLGTAACTPTWFQDFKDNPVDSTEAVLNTAQGALDVAQIAFSQLNAYLAPEQQAAAQAKFDQAVVAATLAMQAVRDAVAAAAEAQNPHPDLFAIIQGVGTAISDVQAVIASIRELASAAKPGAAPGAPVTPVTVPGMAALDQLGARLQAQTK
jgi:hypothetical protein